MSDAAALAEGAAVTLAPELTLFEYGTCADPQQRDRLYQCSDSLCVYLERRFLSRAFDGSRPCLRATEHVGLLPFSVDGKSHLLYIASKGCLGNEALGLRRFLELIALADEKEHQLPDKLPGLEGARGTDLFLLFLAHWYARLLTELCQRDFRKHYRHDEDHLRSRIRGRLRLPAYARLAVRGKRHILPCRWDEFTEDNLDNRVLWAAARRLRTIAAALDAEAAARVWEPFRSLSSWFSGVEEVPVRASDLSKCRLHRTSVYYRRALDWARLLLRGSDLPTHGGQVPALVLDANDAFERFARVVARAELPHGWGAAPDSERQREFVTGRQVQTRKPDILLSHTSDMHAVGDAKYKEVLERAKDAQLENPNEVLKTCIQAADWNQLYVYMRMYEASFGFFVVPFWNAAREADSVEWITPFEFHPSPCDDDVQVAVLALNLLKPLTEVKREAAQQLHRWLSTESAVPD